MKLSQRDKRTVMLGAAVLAGIVLVRLTFVPWLEGWMDARDRSAAARGELNDLQRHVSKMLGQRGRLEPIYGAGVARPLEDIQTARASLFQAAQDVLKANGFSPSDYAPQPPRPVKQVPRAVLVSLQVRGQCQLPQLASCLARLRDARTLVIVDRVSAVGNEKQPGQLEVTMVLTTLADEGRAGS